MINNTKELIKKNLGINLSTFCNQNGFDLNTLNNLLAGKTKGDREGTNAHKIKKFLIENGLFIEENKNESIKINTDNIKNPLLKNFFTFTLNSKLSTIETSKELMKSTHKKVPAILDLYFDMTVQDYIKDSYFKERNINDKDFSQFCFGTSDGSKIGSKAYFIKQKLIEDGILPIILK
ncbi:hypothetical protein H0A43_00010 [Arcobacter lanthieri]|uniref:hypothetical protein n=1 Tax=Aliarcobacter lanthieri TaxID=1355374 RepID=UPI001922D475|nr:hypothetical protein [Aliarcobacter lanthieri]MBL3518856.1 hypothetical protein [Aliarcobacter lanthieri]